MPYSTPQQTASRDSARIQRFQNPLTRVGYHLARDTAHLILLFAGEVCLRSSIHELHHLAEGPRLIWRANGEGEELLVEGGARGTLVSIPDLALMRALPATPLGEQMRRTLRLDLALQLENTPRLEAIITGLDAERSNIEPGADVAGEHYVALVLIQLWRMARTDLVAHGRAPQGLAERFVQLASMHLREHWRVADYSRALGVSRDRLGSAVRRTTGVSPQGYLHREILREASELLTNTGMPVGQIAFRLGYPDPAYFTRFFTRQVGTSPARYRRAQKVRHPANEGSFAAWP